MYIKKFLAILLTLAMCVTSFPVFAQDVADVSQSETQTDLVPEPVEYEYSESLEEYNDSGTFSNGIEWTSEYGMLSIYGNGDMPDFSIGAAPWYGGREEIKFIYIGDGITSVGDYAFYDMANATGIYMPDTVTEIGEGAFMQCSSMPDIKLSKNLVTIKQAAFKGCNSFKKVSIPKNTSTIEAGAFSSCASLEEFVFPEGSEYFVAHNGYGLFTKDMTTLITYPCGLTDSRYVVPNSVKVISPNAFESCAYLSEVVFPEGLEEIGENAFTNCSAIEVMNIPAFVTSIAQNAFLYGCDSLKQINVDENNDNYSSDMGVLYSKDKSTLIQFPSKCDPYVDTEGLEDLSGIYSVDIKTKVIGKEAFLNCSTLYFLQFYSGVKKIEQAAFMGFDSLSMIDFGGLRSSWDEIEKEGFNEILEQLDKSDSIFTLERKEYEATFDAVVGKTYRLEDYISDDVDLSKVEILAAESDKPLVVSVDVEKMEMVALSEGEAIVTATVSEDGVAMPVSAKVVVTKKDGASSDALAINIVQFDTVDIKKSIFIPDEYLDRFSWKSSNSGVASVSNGVVYAHQGGTCEITASTEDNRYSFKFNVVVEQKYTPESYFDFDYTKGHITRYNGNFTDVSIPPTINGTTVTGIANGAFKDRNIVMNVEMPDTVTYIGKEAFANLLNLKSITLHEGITHIGDNAFNRCIGLVKVVIPSTVSSTSGSNWFVGCVNLKTVEFAKGTTSIGRGVRYAIDVRNVIIPSSVTTIEYSAFQGCSGLTNVIIPDSVTSLGYGAYMGCTGLQGVTIGKKVSTVGSSCFENCTRLKNVTIGQSITKLSYRMFYGCTSLVSISVPASVSIIDNSAFSRCSNLSDITLVSGLTQIAMQAFYECKNLKAISLPSTLTKIGNSAFAKSGLAEIVVPTTASLGNSVFADCSDLTKADVSGSKKLPKGTFANCKKLKEVTLNTGITAIGENAFYNCSSLTFISIPNTVNSIGNYAFYNCRLLKQTGNLKGVATVGDYAFYQCSNITALEFGNSLTSIGKYAFSLTKITEFIIPDSVTRLGESAFYACMSLLELTFGSGIKKIPRRVVSVCNGRGVRTVNISEGVTEIDDEAFYGVNTLRTINLPDSVTRIGSSAFEECRSLEYVNFGSGLKVIEDSAFNWCRSLREIKFPDSLETIDRYAFCQCNKLESVEFGEGIKSIGHRSFSDCFELREIVIPDSMQTIGSCAFEYDRNLRKITIGTGVTSIGDRAFRGCNKLTFEGGVSATLARYLINNSAFGIGKLTIDSYRYFDADYTGYSSISEDFYEYIPMELEFCLKEEYKDAINKKITINIPNSAYLINGTMQLDGVPYTDYTEYENAQYNSNQIKVNIPDDVSEGVLAFCIKPTEYTTIFTDASMQLKAGYYNTSEYLGFVNASLPNISISTPDTTGKADIIVEGLSKPRTTVTLYINDAVVDSVRTSSSGIYKRTIKIPNPENYADYKISAEAYVNGENSVAETTVKYINNAPSLEGLTMHYGKIGQRMTVYNLYDITTRPTIRWGSYATGRGYGYHYYFTVNVSNDSTVDKVYVVSTRDGKKEYLEARRSYNGRYVTSGYFAGNCEYIPGALTVEYTRNNDDNVIFAEEAVAYMNFEENVFTPVITEYTDNSYGATVNVDTDIVSDMGNYFNVTSKITDREYLDISGEEFTSYTSGYYAYTIKDNIKDYVLVYDLTDIEKSRVVIHDISDGKELEYTFAFAYNGEDNEPIYISFDEIVEKISAYTGKLLDIYNINVDTNELMDKLRTLDADEETFVEAFDKVKDLEIKKDVFLLTAMAIGSSAIGNISAPDGVLNLMYIALNDDISYFNDLRILNLYKIGSECKIRWMIDPSGYVYEGVTDNRLPGVTATAYCIDNEYVVSFEDEDGNPCIDESATDFSKKYVWDASELDQQNPLTTDQNGDYKWDVPDGRWWQVEYKKDGYEIAHSRWMPVPPPQTDVNIGLVSLAKPKVESIYLTADYLNVTFDKYMDPATVTDVTIGNATYTVEYDKSKTDLEGNNFAKEFTFRFTESFLDGEPVNIIIKGAKSYAGVAMDNYSVTETTPGEPLPNEIIITGTTEDSSNGTIRVDYFNNRKDEKITYDVVCAIYDSSDKLVSVQSITIEDFETGKKLDRTFTFAQQWSYYKVFSINSLSNLKPVIKSYDSRTDK